MECPLFENVPYTCKSAVYHIHSYPYNTQLRTCEMLFVRNQWNHFNVIIAFLIPYGLLSKERIRFLRERIFSFKRRHHFEKGRH